MTDAFISYSHVDRNVVAHLQAGLVSRGKQVWLDDQQIAPASRWADELKAAIEGADAFVFVISPDSAVSAECRKELAHAAALNKRIVPCVVRATDLGLLPAPLPAQQFVPARGVFTDDFAASLDLLNFAIETDHDWVKEHTRWGRKAIDWAEHSHDRSFLVAGSELRAAEDWLARGSGRRPEPTALQNAYVLAARKASDRRQRTWRAALCAGLAVALVLAGVAFVQRNHARTARNDAVRASHLATARAIAAEATADLTTDPAESLPLALRSTEMSATGPAEQALRLALAATPQRAVIASGAGAAALAGWDPTGSLLAVTGPGGTVALWDPQTLHLQTVLHAASGTANLTDLAWSPDGRWLAAGTSAGAVSVWRTPSASPVATSTVDSAVEASRRGRGQVALTWLAGASPELLVSGPALDRVIGFRPSTGSTGAVLATPSGLTDLVTSTDGSRVLAMDASAYDAFQVPGDRRTTFRLPRNGNVVASDDQACWSHDDRTVVTWNPVEAQDPALRFWDAASGTERSTSSFDHTTITAAACATSGSEQWVAAGDAAGSVRLFAAGGTTFALTGQSRTINDIASSPDGTTLATASDDGTARVWDAANGNLLRVLSGDGAPIEHVSFSPNGALVVTVDRRGMVRIWDAGVGQPVTNLAAAAGNRTYALGWTAAGTEIYGLSVAAGSAQAGALRAVIWNAASGRLERSIPLPGAEAAPVACPSDLSVLEFCDLPPPPNLIVDMPPASGRQGSRRVAMAVSGNGRSVAYGQADAVTVIGPQGRSVGRLALPGPPTGLSYVAGNRLLIMTSADVYLWTPGRPAERFAQPSGPIDAEVSADGTRLAVADVGGTVGVWDTASGATVATLHPSTARRPSSVGHIRPVPTRVAISADGTRVSAGTTFQTVITWDVATGRPVSTTTVASPADQVTGGFGGGGPWTIAELRLSAGGSKLLAVDFPQIAAGDSEPPATAAVLSAARGAPETVYTSPGLPGAAINPGAALSPDGGFILSGPVGLAPRPPGGIEAVYQLAGGQLVGDLQRIPTSIGDTAAPVEPWSPSGVEVLAGNAVYACDACGTLAQLQARAAVRLRWTTPLSTARPSPPAGDPYG